MSQPAENLHPARAGARFDWTDPLDLNGQLSEDQRMIRDAARDFAQAKLLPRVVQHYRSEDWDPDIMPEMGEMGLLGASLEGYGCADAGYIAYGLIAREVERVDSGYRSMMSVQSSLVMYPIRTYGTEQQWQKYLPKLASGEHIGCFGLTRTRRRLRSGRHAHPRAKGRRWLSAERHQDLDQQRASGRCNGDLGKDRG